MTRANEAVWEWWVSLVRYVSVTALDQCGENVCGCRNKRGGIYEILHLVSVPDLVSLSLLCHGINL